jgi:hypothetical protein
MGELGPCQLETRRASQEITTPGNLNPFAISENRGPYFRAAIPHTSRNVMRRIGRRLTVARYRDLRKYIIRPAA